MKIINLALSQIESKDKSEFLDNDPFIREYIEVFNENKLFKKYTIKKIDKADKNEIINKSNILIDAFKDTTNLLRKFNIESNMGLIIFIGDGNIDGHGIIVEEYPYVFVDLSAIMPNIEKYDIDAFMLHETIHAIHYSLNKEFYPKNYNSVEDKFLKKLVVEGIATYMSIKLSNISVESAYWLGFLKHDKVEEWIYNCENMKLSIGESLDKIIESGDFNQNIYYRLFYILGLQNLTSYRIGYYYGSQIIRKINNEKSIEEIFTLKFDEMKNYLYEYFKS